MLALLFGLSLATPVRAQSPPSQNSQTSAPQKPASQPAPETTQKPAAPQQSSLADQPQLYDPYHAMKALDVGEYYMKKGDLDAAIDRFQDAIHFKYDYARPRLLLAQIYDRRHEDTEAIRYYNEYLKILPQSPSAKKIRERVEKLSRQLDAANEKHPQHP